MNNNMWGMNNPYNAFPVSFNNGVGNLTRSNKIFVTSMDDALARYAEPNSEMIYLDQDKPVLYEVKTDFQGRKTINLYDLAPSANGAGVGGSKMDMTNYVTKNEFEALQAQIKALEEKINNGGVV